MNSPTTKIQVTLKAAITLDGKIATAGGDSKWITGESARLEGHRLRSQHDAILVGINTVLKDNPSLTTRGIPNGRSPTRIILDSKGRLPSDSKVLEDDGVQVIQVIGNEINPATIKSGKNVEILRAPSAQPEPLWLLEQLEMKGIRSLLVEGGAKVHGSFIESGCVTRLQSVHCSQSDRRTVRTFLVRGLGDQSHRGCNGLEDFVRATPGSGFSSDC